MVELMVVLLIVAILATIAVSSYTAQTRQARRTDAKSALLELAARQERYNSTNSAYTDSATNLGYSGAFPQPVGSAGYYQLSVCVSATLPCTTDAGTGAAFVLTATPQGPQVNDTTCGTFTLDSTGAQSVSGTATAASCWN